MAELQMRLETAARLPKIFGLAILFNASFGSAEGNAQSKLEPLALRCTVTDLVQTTKSGVVNYHEQVGPREIHIQFGNGGIAHIFATGHEINVHVYRYEVTNSLYILDWIDAPPGTLQSQIVIDRTTGKVKEHTSFKTDRPDTLINDISDGDCLPESYQNKF